MASGYLLNSKAEDFTCQVKIRVQPLGPASEGIRLLELAQKVGTLFRQQSPAEKRGLLGFVLSNCTWKDDRLTAAYRRVLDLLALEIKKTAEGARASVSDNWLRIVDAYRTFCIAPSPEVKEIFGAVANHPVPI